MRYVIMIYNANNCSTIDVQFIKHLNKNLHREEIISILKTML